MIAAQLSALTPASPMTNGAWLAPLRNWAATAARSLQIESAVVRVVIASVRGSSPRGVGTSMLVERQQLFGTIGGGQLEWSAIASARSMLAQSNAPCVQLQKLILGPQLSQCCGGAVQLWLERYTSADIPLLNAAAAAAMHGPAVMSATITGTTVERRIIRSAEPLCPGVRAQLTVRDDLTTLQERLDEDQPHVWLYGAGHVGQALARVLATLPLQLTWIDSRPELLPNDLAESVRTVLSNDPVVTVRDAPRDTRFVVMTHSHPLDYALCKAVLERNDQAWLGVIGSKSKSVRFRSRLLGDGLGREQIDRLACPIGIDGIDSKLPAVIAIAVTSQLLRTFETSARPMSIDAMSTETHDCTTGGCKNCALAPGSTP
jgi:xanthine dehydrogenase accessory factor